MMWIHPPSIKNIDFGIGAVYRPYIYLVSVSTPNLAVSHGTSFLSRRCCVRRKIFLLAKVAQLTLGKSQNLKSLRSLHYG